MWIWACKHQFSSCVDFKEGIKTGANIPTFQVHTNQQAHLLCSSCLITVFKWQVSKHCSIIMNSNMPSQYKSLYTVDPFNFTFFSYHILALQAILCIKTRPTMCKWCVTEGLSFMGYLCKFGISKRQVYPYCTIERLVPIVVMCIEVYVNVIYKLWCKYKSNQTTDYAVIPWLITSKSRFNNGYLNIVV